MRIADLNWMQVEELARREDRAILPLGSTEQHAYLSLAVDTILAEKIALDASEGMGIPVFPVVPYGLTPNFSEFPGTVTLRMATYCAMLGEILSSIRQAGFRRILIVNGHGGNSPAHGAVYDWLEANRGCQVRWHNWWNAPATMGKVKAIDPVASHASWMENFPWTRLANVKMPAEQKPMPDLDRIALCDPGEKRKALGDGNYGGLYQRSDAEMAEIWQVAIAETRALITDGWA
ncbi:MAG: creatininase family protein [Proteobacteria bacterium]|nr:creatininase family protein [Pseudomonadota bacterium]